MTGSDPGAYAALFPGAPYNTPGRFDNSSVLWPALQNREQQALEQERLGITASLQWRPTSKTLVNLDGLFSKFKQDSEITQIVDIGLNRNATIVGYEPPCASPS